MTGGTPISGNLHMPWEIVCCVVSSRYLIQKRWGFSPSTVEIEDDLSLVGGFKHVFCSTLFFYDEGSVHILFRWVAEAPTTCSSPISGRFFSQPFGPFRMGSHATNSFKFDGSWRTSTSGTKDSDFSWFLRNFLFVQMPSNFGTNDQQLGLRKICDVFCTSRSEGVSMTVMHVNDIYDVIWLCFKTLVPPGEPQNSW